MEVVVTGATGFIGRRVVASLRARGDRVVALSRDAARARAALGEGVECLAWATRDEAGGAWADAVARADAVVNLAGEPLIGRRWTPAVKAEIQGSRVMATRRVVEAMSRGGVGKRRVLVNSSGVDYYGDTGDREVDEAAPAGDSFLAEVCVAWEAEARRAAELAGTREVRLRTGVVLGEAGGALGKMVTPFKMFVGGPVGSGRQWLPWISHDDMVAVVLAAVDDERLAGAVNAVTRAARMKDFARALGGVMKRPSWAPVPAFAVRVVLGEAAALVLESKRVAPRVLQGMGFQWKHPELEGALRATMGAG